MNSWLIELGVISVSAFESGPGGWIRFPKVSKSFRSNGGPFCSQLIELPTRLRAFRLVEIL